MPEEDLDGFIALMDQTYGKKLARREAREAAQNLLGFFDVLGRIKARQDQAAALAEPGATTAPDLPGKSG